MTHFKLTPEQQQAVCSFSANTDLTGDYSAPTLQQSVLEFAHNARNAVHAEFDSFGPWTSFMLSLSASSAEVRGTAQAFFMAICGWTPETMWEKANRDETAMTTELVEQIESDDSCPFRETARFIQDLDGLNETDQGRLNELLDSVLPGFQLLTVVQSQLLPPIELIQAKVAKSEA